jgi:Fur family peroxide stress response transcriptional regulator
MATRRSKQRERILQALQATDSHPTAEWIYQKLKPEIPNLSLGTVYRNLAILQEQGFVQKMPLGTTDRFEGNITPHYHLVCERCGRVADIEIPMYAEINEKASTMSSFKINRHRIDFFGICEKCQNKTKK